GFLPPNVSALSPRSGTQFGSPTGATAARPSSAPRSTMTSKRGSRPSARASFGKCAQANSVPEASNKSRRDGACSVVIVSSPQEFWCHQQHGERLAAAFGAANGVPRLRRCQRPEALIDQRDRIDAIRHAAGETVGNVKTLRQAIDPGRLIVRETVRPGRAPKRLAHKALPAHESGDHPLCASKA